MSKTKNFQQTLLNNVQNSQSPGGKGDELNNLKLWLSQCKMQDKAPG
jgi:hypothetical protein